MNNIPFVRCVGIGVNIYQNEFKMAYDHRMICILSGDGTIEICDKLFETNTNDIFIINPGISYRVCSGENQKIAVVNFDTNYDFSYMTDPVLSVDADKFQLDKIIKSPPLDFFGDIAYKISAQKTELFEELYQLYLRDDLDLPLKTFLLGSRLLYIISNLLTPGTKSDSVSSSIYNYVIDNACSKITAESVAREFSYSKSYIEKLLRKNYNISLKQLILDTRLKKALWLLENTSLSCSEISSQLGFYSSQHFAQMFKKKYHQNPSDIR